MKLFLGMISSYLLVLQNVAALRLGIQAALGHDDFWSKLQGKSKNFDEGGRSHEETLQHIADFYGYESCGFIGEHKMQGKYGQVFKCKTMSNDKQRIEDVALKVPQPGESPSSNYILEEGFYNYVAWQRAARADLTAEAEKYFERKYVIQGTDEKGSTQLALQSQFYPYTLHRYMKENKPNISEEFILKVAQNLISAVALLQKLQMEYRDLKPDNIAVDPKSGEIKILDWGIVCNSGDWLNFEMPVYDRKNIGNGRAFSGHALQAQGLFAERVEQLGTTSWYQAPDFTFEINPSNALYAIGVTLADLARGSYFFHFAEAKDSGTTFSQWGLKLANLRHDCDINQLTAICAKKGALLQEGPTAVTYDHVNHSACINFKEGRDYQLFLQSYSTQYQQSKQYFVAADSLNGSVLQGSHAFSDKWEVLDQAKSRLLQEKPELEASRLGKLIQLLLAPRAARGNNPQGYLYFGLDNFTALMSALSLEERVIVWDGVTNVGLENSKKTFVHACQKVQANIFPRYLQFLFLFQPDQRDYIWTWLQSQADGNSNVDLFSRLLVLLEPENRKGLFDQLAVNPQQATHLLPLLEVLPGSQERQQIMPEAQQFLRLSIQDQQSVVTTIQSVSTGEKFQAFRRRMDAAQQIDTVFQQFKPLLGQNEQTFLSLLQQTASWDDRNVITRTVGTFLMAPSNGSQFLGDIFTIVQTLQPYSAVLPPAIVLVRLLEDLQPLNVLERQQSIHILREQPANDLFQLYQMPESATRMGFIRQECQKRQVVQAQQNAVQFGGLQVQPQFVTAPHVAW